LRLKAASPIVMAVHLLGRSLYGDNWTGEELALCYRTEPTDQELATRAFAIATDEAIAAAAAELDFRTEAEVFRELRHKRDMEFAPRRRWQLVAERLIDLLYRRVLKATALSPDEGELEIPARLWAATSVIRVFSNGGYLEARSGVFRVPEEPRSDEHAIVVIEQKQFEESINDPTTMTAIRPEPDKAKVEADPYRTGLPGRPTGAHLVVIEFRNREKRGVVEASLKDESEALVRWYKENYTDGPNLTPGTVENRIRELHRQFRGGTK
jgi:hypothetical protein